MSHPIAGPCDSPKSVTQNRSPRWKTSRQIVHGFVRTLSCEPRSSCTRLIDSSGVTSAGYGLAYDELGPGAKFRAEASRPQAAKTLTTVAREK